MYNIIRHQLISDNIDNPIQVGMVVYVDPNGKMDFAYPDDFQSGQGTAIGIVVVPEGFLPDGKARMVGLYAIDNSGVITANSSNNTMALASTGVSIAPYWPLYMQVSATDNIQIGTTGYAGYGIIPSDVFYGIANTVVSNLDPLAAYASAGGVKLQPPYFGDVLNPYYSANEINPSNGYNMNALSDFNGLENTLIYMSLASASSGITPAPYACWNYKDGASNTQWYLPSLGELCILGARIQAILQSFTTLINKNIINQSEASLLAPVGTWWSSTAADKGYGWVLTLNNCQVVAVSSTKGNRVLPFAQIIK